MTAKPPTTSVMTAVRVNGLLPALMKPTQQRGSQSNQQECMSSESRYSERGDHPEWHHDRVVLGVDRVRVLRDVNETVVSFGERPELKIEIGSRLWKPTDSAVELMHANSGARCLKSWRVDASAAAEADSERDSRVRPRRVRQDARIGDARTGIGNSRGQACYQRERYAQQHARHPWKARSRISECLHSIHTPSLVATVVRVSGW